MILCSDSDAGSTSARAFQLTHSLLQLVHLGCNRRQGLGKRVVDLLGVDNHHALAFSQNDVSRHADHGGIVGHVAQHDRSGANPAIVPHRNVAENLRAAAHDDIVEQRGMALAMLFTGPAKSHTLVKRYIVADDRGLTDHHRQGVIDEKSAA